MRSFVLLLSLTVVSCGSARRVPSAAQSSAAQPSTVPPNAAQPDPEANLEAEPPQAHFGPIQDADFAPTLAVLYVDARGTRHTLLDMSLVPEERARGLQPGRVRSLLLDEDNGYTHVELYGVGFDLDRDGISDAMVSISGDNGNCEFHGWYFILMPRADGSFATSQPFGHCQLGPITGTDGDEMRVEFVDTGGVSWLDPTGRVRE